MADLRGEPPDYIVDAVTKDSFGFQDPEKEDIASFPELAQFLSENYSAVSLDASCPRLYAIGPVVAELSKQYVAVGVSVSGGSDTWRGAIDSATFEACLNVTLLPLGGQIVLDLGRAKAIGAVEILNTPRNPSVPRGHDAPYTPLRATVPIRRGR